MLDPDAIETAIRSIEDSRESHLGWIGHDANTCETCRAAPADVAGDDAHHLACIAKYDQVLVVLRAVRALRAVLETSPEELARSFATGRGVDSIDIQIAEVTLAYLKKKAGVEKTDA